MVSASPLFEEAAGGRRSVSRMDVLFSLVAAAAVMALLLLVARSNGRKSQRIAVLASIGTANPPASGGPQEFLAICRKMGYPEELMAKVEKIVAGSGVDKRHTVVADADPERFMRTLEDNADNVRARLWEEWAPKLGLQAAQDAVQRWEGGDAKAITHVVVHSCTGFSAPGMDFALIQGLGLSESTRKIGVNFMGCFGAFTALFVAKQIVEADTSGKAVVLVVCAEICTAHMTGQDQRLELVVGNSLFADGAAAAIVTHAGRSGNKSAGEWALGEFASEIVPDSAEAMTWRQGGICHGKGAAPYQMWLDRSIPKALNSFFASSKAVKLAAKLGIYNLWKPSLAWCIHPGGKAILTAVEKGFAGMGISPRGLEVSKEVLSQFGNMSSPTVCFVLKRLLWPDEGHDEGHDEGQQTATGSGNGNAKAKEAPISDIFALGFGPGLTVEAARLFRLI